MGRKRLRHERTGSDDALFADLDAAQNRDVCGDPTVVADSNGADLLGATDVESVLIRVEDPRAHPDPDAVADIELSLGAQMAAVHEALTANPDSRAGEREDQNRSDVRAESGVGADFDVRALGDREVHAPRAPLGIDARPDLEPGSGGEREVGRGKVRAGFRIESQTGMAIVQTAQPQSIEGLDRLESPAGRARSHEGLLPRCAEHIGEDDGIVGAGGSKDV